MSSVPHLPDVFEVRTQQGCMGQKDSLDTPAESDESYEASEALLNAMRAQAGIGQPSTIKN